MLLRKFMPQAFHSILSSERDTNNDILWVWSYPTIEDSTRDLVMRRCTLDKEGDEVIDYCFCHYQQTWCYLSNFQCDDNPQLPKVMFMLVCLYLILTSMKCCTSLHTCTQMHTHTHAHALPFSTCALQEASCEVLDT